MKYLRFLLLPLWYGAMSCATQTTPMGGPKDTIPPTVARYMPQENQTNFRGTQIEVEFNEDIVLNNPKDEIIIIPSTGKKTEYKLRGKSLIIIPEFKLKDSTTYNLTFRESVKDLTEGNLAVDARGSSEKDIHLAFSTGPVIDTLSISGTVKNALSEQIPPNITIALYSADTFKIFEHTPEYFTKSNKLGKWTITNLKAGKYKVYAFEDKNKNLKAETRSEKFGFLSRTIELDSAVTGLQIQMVNIDTRIPKITTNRNQSSMNIIRLNKSMTDYQIITDEKIVSSFNNNQSEIIAYYPETLTIDSTMIQIKSIDSTEQIIDTLVYIKRDKKDRTPETFKPTSGEAIYNIETGIFEYSMSYNKPLKAITIDSAYIQYDSLTRIPIRFKSIKIDTIFNRLTIREPISIDSLPMSPALTLAKGFLISLDNDSMKSISPSIKILDTQSTAVMIVEVQTKQPHFIIQLINGSNKIIRTAADQKKLTFKHLVPEVLKIRVVIDTNGNGKWDTAIYPQNREPEKIIYYLNSEKTTEIPLRANWEVGPLVIKF